MTHKDFKKRARWKYKGDLCDDRTILHLYYGDSYMNLYIKKHCIESQAPPTPNWRDENRVCGLYQSQFPDSDIVQELRNALYYWQRLGDESQIKDLSVLFLQLPVSL